MEYGADDCLLDLMKIWNSTVTDDDEASLNFFLLAIMRDKGSDGVVDLIRSFDQSKLGNIEISQFESEVTIRMAREGFEPLVVRAGDDEFSPWIDVRIESHDESIMSEDPRHTEFYSIWERILKKGGESVAPSSPEENAVYLMAILELEVMNGGIGQYLTNTEGRHLSETFSCLEQIGATRTYALLTAAVNLAYGFDSYVDAWDEKSESYSRIDAELLDSDEDLAALTVDAFLQSEE
jgi:hypothetical protein